MENRTLAVLLVLDSALEKGLPRERLFGEVVEALVQNLELEAALLEITGAEKDTASQLVEAGGEDSRKLLKRVRGERMEKLFELFGETVGFRTDRVSFWIRRTPPLGVKAFKIISGRECVGQLSLLVKEETAYSGSVEEFASFLCSHLGLLWPIIRGTGVARVAEPSPREQLREVGLDSQKLLENLWEEVNESLKPELVVLAFPLEGKEHLRTLAFPGTVVERHPLLRALPFANTSFGEVLSTHSPLLCTYREETIKGIDDKLFTDMGLRSGVMVPVPSQGETVAVLFVGSKTMEEYVEDNANYLGFLARETAEIIGNIVTFTRVKDSVEDVKRRYEKMVKAEKIESIAEVAVTINHEINNPLMAILGNTQLLLLRGESLEPELVEKLKLIERSCLRIQKVTQKLMAMAEPKATYYTNGCRMLDIEASAPPEEESW